jgi:hypothetical protein
MKTKTLLLSALVTFCFILTSCEKNKEKKKSEYINLEYGDFFKLPDTKIVDSIASILKIKPFVFDGYTNFGDGGDNGISSYKWIKEGKKYVNTDGQLVTLWVDSLDNLATITYLSYRQSKSDTWNNDEIQLDYTAKKLFLGFGFVQKPNEDYSITTADGGIKDTKW